VTIARREAWGYVVWGAMALVVGVPEVWAAVARAAPWPTISGTIGYLEYHHTWVAVVVIAVVVFAAYHAVRVREDRTDGGRMTGASALSRPDIRAAVFFPLALAGVVVGSVGAHALRPHDKHLYGEVLYGLIALLWIVVPSVLAYVFAKDVPFPTLFATLASLEARVRWVAVLVVAGLVVLLVHLAFYPWPAIIPDLQDLHRNHAPSPYAP
jgi:hypothetical protein